MSVRVPFPVNTILFLFLASIVSYSCDSFYFPFGMSIFDLGWWLHEIGAMCFCFLIRRQIRCMEDIVDLPCPRELELIRHMA